MATTTTVAGSSNAVAALYQAAYVLSVRKALGYSQSPFVFTPPQGVMGAGNRGSAVKIPMFHELDWGSSLSETADVTPVTFYANLATITPELYGQAVQLSQKLSLTAFTDVEQAAVEMVGRNAAATREIVARAQAIAGALVLFGGSATTRATVKAVQTTSTSLISYTNFVNAAMTLNAAGAPKIGSVAGNLSGYAAIISAETQGDLGISSAFIIAAEYGANEFLLNGEVGTHLTGTRLVQTPFAKVFRGAAATVAGASGPTIDAVVPGSTVLQVSSAMGSHAIGDYMFIGSSIESTGQDDITGCEIVRVVSGTTGSTGPYGIVGAGVNGGFMYAHPNTHIARGDVRDVQCTVFVGSESIGMVYSNEDGLGPEGQIILPEVTGILHQFNNIGWKGFWGFGRVSENRVVRVEHGSSFQTIGH